MSIHIGTGPIFDLTYTFKFINTSTLQLRSGAAWEMIDVTAQPAQTGGFSIATNDVMLGELQHGMAHFER